MLWVEQNISFLRLDFSSPKTFRSCQFLTNLRLMTKKIILLSIVAALFNACKNEPSATAGLSENPAATTPSAASDTIQMDGTSASPAAAQYNAAVEKLRSQAIQETDYYARVQASIVPLQEELTRAKGKIPDLGKVTVSVDEHFNLLIRNEIGKDVLETKAPLKDLNVANGGMDLIRDTDPGTFPGIRLRTIPGRPEIQFFKNGKLEKTEAFLEIYLPTRPNIERIVPVMVQTINIVNEMN